MQLACPEWKKKKKKIKFHPTPKLHLKKVTSLLKATTFTSLLNKKSRVSKDFSTKFLPNVNQEWFSGNWSKYSFLWKQRSSSVVVIPIGLDGRVNSGSQTGQQWQTVSIIGERCWCWWCSHYWWLGMGSSPISTYESESNSISKFPFVDTCYGFHRSWFVVYFLWFLSFYISCFWTPERVDFGNVFTSNSTFAYAWS